MVWQCLELASQFDEFTRQANSLDEGRHIAWGPLLERDVCKPYMSPSVDIQQDAVVKQVYISEGGPFVLERSVGPKAINREFNCHFAVVEPFLRGPCEQLHRPQNYPYRQKNRYKNQRYRKHAQRGERRPLRIDDEADGSQCDIHEHLTRVTLGREWFFARLTPLAPSVRRYLLPLRVAVEAEPDFFR